MGQDKKTPVSIDNVEYIYEDLTQEQQASWYDRKTALYCGGEV